MAARSSGDLFLLADQFPELSETFIVNEIRALQATGWNVRVEAARHANAPARGATGFHVSYAEDDSLRTRLAALVWVLARHPLRALRDLSARLRWRREEAVPGLNAIAPVVRRAAAVREAHLHAHFAAGAALTALRVGRLLGRPYSVTAHAFDIYQHPRNLVEKLERAAFVTSGCDYTVAHLRGLMSPAAADRVHRVVMGVDGERLRRQAPHPAGRTVVAIGRLVPKKGLGVLLDAVAVLEALSRPVDRLVIVGDGPLRGELEAQARRLGVAGNVEFRGALEHALVPSVLEEVDVLAVPCVIAPDGDRDSMPVVAKEALALELPVVASDQVGLPEIVRPPWGWLVEPGNPEALAAAIEEVLALAPAERAQRGREGRAFVLAHADVKAETAKLAELIGEVSRRSAGSAGF